MKKITVLIMALLLMCSVLTACGEAEQEQRAVPDEAPHYESTLEVLDGEIGRSAIVTLYDTDTKVMYVYCRRGGITPMINADGTPKLYEGR